MPNIRSSADLRNNYNEIATYCHDYDEPVFITKNGKGDLVVMSMETYEMMQSKIELYDSLLKGLHDVKNGRTQPLSEALAEIKDSMK